MTASRRALLIELRSVQNHPAHECRDIMTITGFMADDAEVVKHIQSCREQADAWDVRHATKGRRRSAA